MAAVLYALTQRTSRVLARALPCPLGTEHILLMTEPMDQLAPEHVEPHLAAARRLLDGNA